MHLYFYNVDDAFTGIVSGIQSGNIHTVKSSSRNGPVAYIPEPVTITYQQPRQRVLFNAERDCNPFFAVYESLWMLSGRNDIAPLVYYNSQMAQFSDDGETQNDAYGFRWLHPSGKAFAHQNHFGNQLKLLIDHLKSKPDSRRAVLQMWTVQDDLLKVETSKAVCCNVCAMFMLCNTGVCSRDHNSPDCPCRELGHKDIVALDMTVVNRSNDIILGMLGANVVHFSFLQEYMACALGAEVGVYHQISNNAHVYLETFNSWNPDKWLRATDRTMYDPKPMHYANDVEDQTVNGGVLLGPPLLRDVTMFDAECAEFVERHSKDATAGAYHEPFLASVAQPMMIAFHHHKRRDYAAALQSCYQIQAEDWRCVAEQWIRKRKQLWEKKNVKSQIGRDG